jgi:F0F1-type ATP synthase assembly protein I
LEVFVNKFLKSLLRLGLDLAEQSERAGRALRRQEDHTVRNVISFTAGIAVGVGIGILLAPASEKTRGSIAGKIQGVGARVRDRFSPEVKKPATVTEGK